MSGHDGEKADSGIQVYLRIRPSKNPSTYFQRDDIDLNHVLVKVPKKAEQVVNNSRSGYQFSFSGVLDDKASQRDVFRAVGVPALRNALAGYNSTIFAYGQTGSGKTFTITGGPERYEDRGLIPRSIAHLFKSMKSEEGKGVSYSCFVSYLEIYNQSGYDLLAERRGGSYAPDETPKVTMLEDEDGNFHFKNLSVQAASSEEDALNLLFLGDTNRAIAATEMNENSTRSHCIFSILLERRADGADTVTRSKLNIVDLAGSERVSRTSSAGQTLREAKYINSSLFFLEMVIVALHEKGKKKKERVHVPYRNSMMTSVLRDSLGGNCKTTMIATISPESQYTDESISTCHFAQRVALVKNSASVNEVVEPEMVIQRLRAEVKRLREEVEFLSGKNDDGDSDGEGQDEHGNLAQDQMNELAESIQKYVQDRDESSRLDFCGGITLPRIRAVCSIFKNMLLQKSKEKNTIDDDRGSSDEESEKEDASHAQSIPNKSGKRKGGRPESQELKMNKEKGDETPQPKSRSKSTINGVPPCRDKRVLDDPNAAFSWFKDRYPGRAALDANKSSLKLKYSEAKQAGKKIEDIRSTISHHKAQIEHIRKAHAISMLSGYDEKLDDSGLAADEKFHSDAIDQEKLAYKETIDRLRGLKSTIEDAQKEMEKGRHRLQSDFDTWYQRMCSEDSRSDPPPSSRESVDRVNEPTASISSASSHRIGNLYSGGTATRIPEAGDGKSPANTTNKEFKLPPGIQLTGNAEADADIVAFFKAKEVLLAKTRNRT